MATMQQLEYTLPDGRPLTVRFFRDLQRFRHALVDHVLNPREPWHRSLGVSFLKTLCQKFNAGEVSVIEEAYSACVPVLDAGIRFSIGLPVYVEFKQERRPLGSAKPYTTGGFYFLSNQGFLVVVRDDVVRTAGYRGTGIKGVNASKQDLFKEAWKYVRQRSRGSYVDSKDGEDVRHTMVLMVSPDNWERCAAV